MTAKRLSRRKRWLLIGGAFLVLLALALVYFFGPRWLEQKRSQVEPPTVIVHSPVLGESAAEGDLLLASATASSRIPVARVELWLDGELYGQQVNNPSIPEGVNTLDATFIVDVSAGTHVLVWRAVDNTGLIGQSIPISIGGSPRLGVFETTIVTADDGQTLKMISDDLGAEPDVLVNLNPDLGSGSLPGGTSVKIPTRNEDADPAQTDQGETQVFSNQPDPQPENPDITELFEINIPTISINEMLSFFVSRLPAAPTQLQASFNDCAVKLLWKDNADNETRFNIWMQREHGPPQHIATTPHNPEDGPTLFEFKSPKFGFYNFWVEATNALGSQPSEVREVFVGQICGNNLATEVEIVADDMFIYGSSKLPPVTNVYCYLSLEGTPEKRIPEKGDIAVQNNFGDITNYWGKEKRILFPMPADEELTLEGECLGVIKWAEVPFSIGTFSESIPRSKWDGSRLEIKSESGAYVIGFHIQPFGSTQAQGRFNYVNFDFPYPEVWRVEAESSDDPSERDWKARHVTVSWHWPGNPDDINNFLILIDGKEFRYAHKLQTQESFIMGSSCGGEIRIQIVAVGSGGARSAPSNSFPYKQAECAIRAEVTFNSFRITAMDDSEEDACDGAQLKIILSAGPNESGIPEVHTAEYFGVESQCNHHYYFKEWFVHEYTTQVKNPYGDVPIIIIPLGPTSSLINIGAFFFDNNYVGNAIWDTDIICKYQKTIKINLNNIASADQDFSETCPNETLTIKEKDTFGEYEGSVILNYSVRVFASPTE